MNHRYIKIGATLGVLLLAFMGLMWTSLREGAEYYKNINEITNHQEWEGKRLQLHGYVVPGTWMKRPNSLEYRFRVQNNPARQASSGGVVDATYTGILPDTFKDEAEVVLKGRFSPGGGFHVESVMAKCPSKYQEQEKAASPAASSRSSGL